MFEVTVGGEWEMLMNMLPFLIPVMILQTALLVAAIISIARKNVPKEKGTERIIWLLVVLFVNIFGPIIYFAVGSRRLDEHGE